ncbi:MAG TPA: hypothetical protein VGE89_12975 [Bryobacteraceae bacterium]|jgi:uncharacterized protein (TIGR03437 family)
MKPRAPRSFLRRPRSASSLVAAGILGLALTGSIARAAGSNDSSAPAITAVLNNYSYILPSDVNNYGIAPGSIFVIFGSGMATPGAPAVLQDSSKGLPSTLNGASVSVTVAGLTVQPALYYATAAQIAAVLPSTTPLGPGTVTVTYNEVTSAPATIPVIQSALGFATMPGDGTGPAMATDANYNFISPTNSAAGGQIITLWGTGLGASPADSDTTYTPTPHQITSVPLTIFFGGQQVPAVWAGRSGYPGLDQINVQLPVPSLTTVGYVNGVSALIYGTTLPLGCATSLIAADVDSGVGSNTVTLPISAAGGVCTQPSFVLDPTVAQALSGQTTVNLGSLSVSQDGSQAVAGGYFEPISGAALAPFAGSAPASEGSCIAVPTGGSQQIGGLGAGGFLSVTGPAGQQTLATDDTADYGGIMPASMIPAGGGTFTFVSGSGSYANVGPFNVAVKFPAALDWTNQASIGTIHRSQGVQLTWTGGDADGIVAIRGSSFAAAGAQTPSGSFMCSVPASAGQFTVPPSVLQALPAGAGTLTVENQSAAQTIPATGLDIGHAFGGAMFTINAAYN